MFSIESIKKKTKTKQEPGVVVHPWNPTTGRMDSWNPVGICIVVSNSALGSKKPNFSLTGFHVGED